MTALAKRVTVTCFTGLFCLSALFADRPNISSSSPDLQGIFDNVGPAVKNIRRDGNRFHAVPAVAR